MDPKGNLLEALFEKKCKNEKVCLDCAGVYGSHRSPSCGALRVIPKIEEKRKLISEPHLWPQLFENTERSSKRSPNG